MVPKKVSNPRQLPEITSSLVQSLGLCSCNGDTSITSNLLSWSRHHFVKKAHLLSFVEWTGSTCIWLRTREDLAKHRRAQLWAPARFHILSVALGSLAEHTAWEWVQPATFFWIFTQTTFQLKKCERIAVTMSFTSLETSSPALLLSFNLGHSKWETH